MPYYYFDLVVGDEFKNQGSIILEDLEVASDRAAPASRSRSAAARCAADGRRRWTGGASADAGPLNFVDCDGLIAREKAVGIYAGGLL